MDLNNSGDHFGKEKKKWFDAYKQSFIIYRTIQKLTESKSGNRFSIIYQANSHWYLRKPTKLMSPVNGMNALIINFHDYEHYMNYPRVVCFFLRGRLFRHQSADKRSAPSDIFHHVCDIEGAFPLLLKIASPCLSNLATANFNNKLCNGHLWEIFSSLSQTCLKPSACLLLNVKLLLSGLGGEKKKRKKCNFEKSFHIFKLEA